MSTKPETPLQSPLLFRPGIAGAVARAIEHFPGQDLEGFFAKAAVLGEPLYSRERRTELFTRSRTADRQDDVVMGWAECLAISGARPAQRVELQP